MNGHGTGPHNRELVILICEEESIAKLLQQGLQDRCTVLLATSDRQVIDLYRKLSRRISLVVLDALDSSATLNELRKIDPAVRCCLLTAGSELSLDELQKLGVEGVFGKPFQSLAALASAILELAAPCTCGG